jgi:hypothetical protein
MRKNIATQRYFYLRGRLNKEGRKERKQGEMIKGRKKERKIYPFLK